MDDIGWDGAGAVLGSDTNGLAPFYNAGPPSFERLMGSLRYRAGPPMAPLGGGGAPPPSLTPEQQQWLETMMGANHLAPRQMPMVPNQHESWMEAIPQPDPHAYSRFMKPPALNSLAPMLEMSPEVNDLGNSSWWDRWHGMQRNRPVGA